MRIIISQHTTFTWGPGSMLTSYLKNCKELLLINHPFDNVIDKPSFYQVFKDGNMELNNKVGSTHRPIISYLKDFFTTISIVLRQKQKYDLFIGIDPLNAFAGLILKYLGKTKRVIFYPIDYSPTRFENKLLNWFYHYIELYCAKHSDSVWLSVRHFDVFVQKGVDKKKCIITPNQVEKIFQEDMIDRLKAPRIAYIGNLSSEKGIDLIIDSMPEIIRSIPQAKLIIIGRGPEEKKLQQKIKENNLENNVIMTGFIESRDEALEILSKCTIGVSPYQIDKEEYTGYGFAAKLVEYVACGLPVITTIYWKELEEDGFGLMINYSTKELASAVIKLLKDKDFYSKCRISCYKQAQKHYYKNVYDMAFSTINMKMS